MIKFNEKQKTFAIQLPKASYFLQIDEDGVLRNLYWGAKISDVSGVELEMPVLTQEGYARTEAYREEFLCRGKSSYFEPCLMPEFFDGTRDARLYYQSHEIIKAESGEKLIIILKDEYYPMIVELHYTVYNGLDLISKNAVIKNIGAEDIVLNKMKSGSVYPPWKQDIRLMYFSGKWAGEYQKKYTEIQHGKFTIENTRGTSSGPQFVPFFAIDEGDATETMGNVWYGSLHWSGNFRIDVEKTFHDQVIITAGVNEFDCCKVLKADEKFETPILTIGFSDCGYEKMSETLYDFQFDFYLQQEKHKSVFPIICNTWYPYEFDVDEKKCLSYIDKVKKIGGELFVIDDGWMIDRKNDHGGLGVWECDPVKFPNGLKPIADKVHENGMLFGLWVEPEMVTEDSPLFKEHPEWVLQYKTRSRTQWRHQCVLNLAREDVKDFVFKNVDRLISEYKLDYLKWDMNTYFTEVGNAYNGEEKEIWIKYIQNLYDVWERIKYKYPNVLLENSAHGGARSDYGLLKNSDRINRSDNADPIDVLKLHEGFTMMFLPKLAGGAGNISSSPNGINGRISPLRFRAHLGMTGCMSVGIDLLKASEEEMEKIKEYIDEYKEIRDVTQHSYLYRLESAFDTPYVVWEYLERNRKSGVIFMFAHGMNFEHYPHRVRLRGLESDKTYKVSGLEKYYFDNVRRPAPDMIAKGDVLMNFGIRIEPKGDYDSQIIKIEELID